MNYGKTTNYKHPNQQRTELAEDTMKKVQEGSYVNSKGEVVSLSANTRQALSIAAYYDHGSTIELNSHRKLVKQAISDSCSKGDVPGHTLNISVINQTTMQAAVELLEQGGKTLMLNFASAKHPGGGFLHGAQAQEECLARSSDLYHTLTTEKTKPFYTDNMFDGSSLYTHGFIHSPGVTFFKDDNGTLLDDPYQIDVLTSAAVNAGKVTANEPLEVSRINPVMEERIECVLSFAADRGYENLILGAWGCGVFANDPDVISNVFKDKLENDFKGYFKEARFAVLDFSDDKQFIGPFEKNLLN